MSIWVRKGKPGELELVFHYNEEYIAKVKAIHGRRWDKENKRWLVPDREESLEQLKGLFSKGELVIDKRVINEYKKEPIESGDSKEQLLKSMKEGLKLRGYSPQTIKSYMSHIRLFLDYCSKNANTLNKEDINRYLLYLLDEKGNAHSFISQAVSSIKIYMFMYF